VPTDAPIPWARWASGPVATVPRVPDGVDPAPRALDWFGWVGDAHATRTPGVVAGAIDPATIEAARSIAAIARAMADAQTAVAEAHAVWLRQAMAGPWGAGGG
jgi:hypothetical protein